MGRCRGAPTRRQRCPPPWRTRWTPERDRVVDVGMRIDVREQLFQLHFSIKGLAVQQHVIALPIEIDHTFSRFVLHPGGPGIELLWDSPPEHLLPRWKLRDREIDPAADGGERVLESRSAQRPVAGKELGHQRHMLSRFSSVGPCTGLLPVSGVPAMSASTVFVLNNGRVRTPLARTRLVVKRRVHNRSDAMPSRNASAAPTRASAARGISDEGGLASASASLTLVLTQGVRPATTLGAQ